ncbi:MAG: ABC transporter substrate-binding protein [Acidimicrobiales bacterium]
MAVTVAAVGLIAAACGDSGSDSATTTTAKSATAATAATAATGATTAAACDTSKPSIKIGGVAQVANFGGIEDGINARIARENKTCIQGRRLEFVGMKDDASDPQKNLDLNKSLVESDKVFALINTSAVMLPQTTNYLADKKVPYFGWGFMPGFCGAASWGYGFNGCLSGYAFDKSKTVTVPGAKLNSSLLDPIAEIVKKDPDKMSIVYFNSDDDAGKAGDLQYTALFKNVLDKQFVPTKGVTDFTQYVNIVKAKSPDAVMLSTDFATAVKLKAAIIAGGYKGIVYDYTTYVPGLLDASKDTAAALEGGYSNTQIPPSEDGKAGTAQIAADLKAIGKAEFVTLGGSVGYWSTDLMIQMLKAISGDITADNFRKVAEAGFTYKPVDGGIGEIKYPDGHFNPAPCAAIVQVKGGKYVSAVPFKCYKLIDPPK